MAKKTIITCDKCGSESDCAPFNLTTGRSYDGVETSDDITVCDLCFACTVVELRKFLNPLSHKQASDWIVQLSN